MNVLQDGPELDAVAGHQAHGALDRGQVAEGGELVEEIEDGGGRLRRIAGHVHEALGDEEAEPP